MGLHVALLRGVNVGGRKLPMAGLRTLCEAIGWADVRTYIQSGNVIFSATGSAASLEEALEEGIRREFGLDVPVIVRSARQWSVYAGKDNPFPGAARDEPNRLLLFLSKKPPAGGAEEAIEARAKADEKVRRSGDAIWIHFPNGSGTSKLTPTLIDRFIGAPATSRNHRTVMKLQEMLSG